MKNKNENLNDVMKILQMNNSDDDDDDNNNDNDEDKTDENGFFTLRRLTSHTF